MVLHCLISGLSKLVERTSGLYSLEDFADYVRQKGQPPAAKELIISSATGESSHLPQQLAWFLVPKVQFCQKFMQLTINRVGEAFDKVLF